MSGLFSGWPYPVAVAALFAIAFLRGGLTYLLGRAVELGAARTRAARLMRTPAYRRARRAVSRWGAPVVSISFLTVGFQTLVNVAAGVAQMPRRRYVPALAVGALLWAFLYATVGFVAFAAVSALYDRSPALALGASGVAVGVLGWFVLAQVRSARRDPDPSVSAGEEPVGE